jgi:hypothetical protein
LTGTIGHGDTTVSNKSARSTTSSTLDQLLKLCDELGIEPEDLDEEVQEAKAEESSRINNGGLDDQLGFLRDTGFAHEELEHLIRTLAAKKLKGV